MKIHSFFDGQHTDREKTDREKGERERKRGTVGMCTGMQETARLKWS